MHTLGRLGSLQLRGGQLHAARSTLVEAVSHAVALGARGVPGAAVDETRLLQRLAATYDDDDRALRCLERAHKRAVPLRDEPELCIGVLRQMRALHKRLGNDERACRCEWQIDEIRLQMDKDKGATDESVSSSSTSESPGCGRTSVSVSSGGSAASGSSAGVGVLI